MALAQILGRRDQVEDNKGDPLAGGLVNIYEPNTTNRVTSYVSSDIVVANPNPVPLSGSGRANIWVTRNVDVRITDKDGNLVVEELSVNPDDLGGEFDSGLIPNGSFEIDADANDVPDGWLLENEGAGSNNGLDTGESTDGGQSWRSQSAGSGGGELVTENFFPVNDVDDLRVNFDLRSTVATVRNIVRVEWYDISQVFISNSDVYDSTANPASFTSEVLQASPPGGARFAKLRIFGGTSGGILAGITYWDRFQVFYPQIVSGVFDNITISGNDIITTNTNGDLNLTPNGTGEVVVKNLTALIAPQFGFAGEVTLEINEANFVRIRTDTDAPAGPAGDVGSGGYDFYDLDGSTRLGQLGYIGAASGQLRLRNDVHGGEVALTAQNDAGSEVFLFQGDPDGGIDLYADGLIRLRAGSTGIMQLRSDGNTDAESRYILFEHQDGTDRSRIGTIGAVDSFTIQHLIEGGSIRVEAEPSGGGTARLLIGDPDANLDLYHPSTDDLRLRMGAAGAVVLYSDDSTDAEPRTVTLAHADGTTRGVVGHTGGTLMRINNQIHGGHVQLDAERTSDGANRVLFTGDPDATVDIYHPADNEINLQSGSHDGADRSSGFDVRGADGVLRGIGYNLLPRVAVSGGNHTVAMEDQGMSLFYDEGTARSIIFNNDGDIPVDAYGHIRVGPTAGLCTLDAGTGVSLSYWNGSVYVAHTAAANLEITGGSFTWWKDTDTSYYIDGPGIATA